MLRVWLLVGCVGLLSACSAPVEGFWESDAELANGERNKLEIYSDSSGEAELWATSCTTCGDWSEFKFDVTWIDYGTEFELEMECDEGLCDGADFTMDCEVIEEDDGTEKMDCDGDGKWAGYFFDWQRDE